MKRGEEEGGGSGLRTTDIFSWQSRIVDISFAMDGWMGVPALNFFFFLNLFLFSNHHHRPEKSPPQPPPPPGFSLGTVLPSLPSCAFFFSLTGHER